MEIHKKIKYALLLVALIIGISGISLADSEDGNITYTAKYKDASSYDITISGLGAPEENYDYYALICQEKDVTTSDFASVFGKSFSIEYDENDNTWKGNTLAAHDGVKLYGVFEKAGQYYGYIARKPKVSASFEIMDGPTEVPMPELPPLGERISIHSSWASKTSCYIKVNSHNTMGGNGVQRTIRFYLGEVTDQNLLQELSEKGTVVYDKLLVGKIEKKPSCIENKLDVLIEDDPQYVNEMSEFMPVIILDTYYNKQCTGNNIIRAFDWEEVYSNIKMLEKNLSSN